MADGRTPELAGPQGRASQLGNMRKTLEDLYKAADEILNAARAAHDRAEVCRTLCRAVSYATPFDCSCCCSHHSAQASRMNQAQSSRAARASYDAELAIHAVMASAARDAQQQFQAAITAAVRARKGAEAQADAALRAVSYGGMLTVLRRLRSRVPAYAPMCLFPSAPDMAAIIFSASAEIRSGTCCCKARRQSARTRRKACDGGASACC